MPEWINTVFDVVMLSAIAGMWVLWWRTSRKQRAIESMLLEAAKDLETATSRLGESLEYIQRLKQEMAAAPSATRRRPEPEVSRESATEERPKHEPPSGHITQMLRMRREGKGIDEIAESLDIPKAQVKLLLKLHAAGE